MPAIPLLASVPRAWFPVYEATLTASGQYTVTLLSDGREALAALNDRSSHYDAVIIDSRLPDAGELLDEIADAHPRMIVVWVDESVNPPLRAKVHADHICTSPFEGDELEQRITRLLADRQLETIHANTALPVRELARLLRADDQPGDRFQIAVEACRTLGYDYAAFYRVDQQEPIVLKLAAQCGLEDMHLLVPLSASGSDLIAQVASNGESRILTHDTAADYLPVSVGELGSAALVAAGRAVCFGVLVAGKIGDDGITTQNLTVLELVGAQLGAAISRELGM